MNPVDESSLKATCRYWFIFYERYLVNTQADPQTIQDWLQSTLGEPSGFVAALSAIMPFDPSKLIWKTNGRGNFAITQIGGWNTLWGAVVTVAIREGRPTRVAIRPAMWVLAICGIWYLLVLIGIVSGLLNSTLASTPIINIATGLVFTSLPYGFYLALFKDNCRGWARRFISRLDAQTAHNFA